MVNAPRSQGGEGVSYRQMIERAGAQGYTLTKGMISKWITRDPRRRKKHFPHPETINTFAAALGRSEDEVAAAACEYFGYYVIPNPAGHAEQDVTVVADGPMTPEAAARAHERTSAALDAAHEHACESFAQPAEPPALGDDGE